MPQGKDPNPTEKCPAGHKLPRKGCTPFYCLDTRAKGGGKGSGGKGKRLAQHPNATSQRQARVAAESAALRPLGLVPAINTGADALASQADEAQKLGIKAGRHMARRGLVPVPEGLAGGEAEEYAQKKLVELLPEAVANMEYDLKYGDDKQRAEAAHRVLSANGMAQREQVGNMVPPIVLNFTGTLPWMQVEKTLTPTGDTALMKKVKARAQIVDGEATRSKDGESGPDGDGP